MDIRNLQIVTVLLIAGFTQSAVGSPGIGILGKLGDLVKLPSCPVTPTACPEKGIFCLNVTRYTPDGGSAPATVVFEIKDNGVVSPNVNTSCSGDAAGFPISANMSVDADYIDPESGMSRPVTLSFMLEDGKVNSNITVTCKDGMGKCNGCPTGGNFTVNPIYCDPKSPQKIPVTVTLELDENGTFNFKNTITC